MYICVYRLWTETSGQEFRKTRGKDEQERKLWNRRTSMSPYPQCIFLRSLGSSVVFEPWLRCCIKISSRTWMRNQFFAKPSQCNIGQGWDWRRAFLWCITCVFYLGRPYATIYKPSGTELDDWSIAVAWTTLSMAYSKSLLLLYCRFSRN
jgi:hypothetical protein